MAMKWALLANLDLQEILSMFSSKPMSLFEFLREMQRLSETTVLAKVEDVLKR